MVFFAYVHIVICIRDKMANSSYFGHLISNTIKPFNYKIKIFSWSFQNKTVSPFFCYWNAD